MKRYSLSTTLTEAVLLGLAIIGLTVGLLPSASEAEAHDAFGWVDIGGDKLYNWDFRSESQSSGNTDWPVSVIFWNNASKEKVEAEQQRHLTYNCNVLGLCNQDYRFDDGFGWVWETDGGRKAFRCGLTGDSNDRWALHYRSYGSIDAHEEDGATRLYNPWWGFYLPMTTHFDYDDPNIPQSSCDNTIHGYDEIASNSVCNIYNALSGWQCVRDWKHMHNTPPAHRLIDGRSHFGDGDGNAHIVYVPN